MNTDDAQHRELELRLEHCHISGYKISKCAEYLSVSVPAAKKLMGKYLKAKYEEKVKA